MCDIRDNFSDFFRLFLFSFLKEPIAHLFDAVLGIAPADIVGNLVPLFGVDIPELENKAYLIIVHRADELFYLFRFLTICFKLLLKVNELGNVFLY